MLFAWEAAETTSSEVLAGQHQFVQASPALSFSFYLFSTLLSTSIANNFLNFLCLPACLPACVSWSLFAFFSSPPPPLPPSSRAFMDSSPWASEISFQVGLRTTNSMIKKTADSFHWNVYDYDKVQKNVKNYNKTVKNYNKNI
mmetsp:Transcript_34139/g.106936  ORF Transcript_34139/g.106936 Transcript_34139/m.106936 type:complete len:143 (+) Transcript_34139:548-976(+)